MGFWDLLLTASIPVLEVLIVTALGCFIATEGIGILTEEARSFMNRVVFYVFNPALVGGNIADTVTVTTLVDMWFMPVNIFLTFLIGSVLGWILMKVTRTPPHLKALVLGSCSAGNLGNLPIIVVPEICEESGNPFGDSATCTKNGLAYASLSMALGAIYIWTYVYNVMRISCKAVAATNSNGSSDHSELSGGISDVLEESNTEPLLPYTSDERAPLHVRCMQSLKMFTEKINLRNILAPSTCGAMVGFIIGLTPQIRKLIIGDNALLRVIETSTSLLGQGAIPTITLIIGGNLLMGIQKSGVKKRIIVGVIVVRYILLPLIGIAVVKAAHYVGFVKADPLYQFVLMLQFALPPATATSTMTQLFRLGEKECSVIMLWTYIFASFAITLWATFYMVLVS